MKNEMATKRNCGKKYHKTTTPNDVDPVLYTAANREAGREIPLTDVFVSYARQDRDRIAPLVRALEARGLEVWWDSRITGGAEFTTEIEAQLEAAGAVLVVWSRNSIQSRWVADEASAGAERGKLVPISIDRVAPRIGFRQFQTLEFGAWNQDPSDPCVTLLLEALAAQSPLPARPEAPRATPARSAAPPATKATSIAAFPRPTVAVPLVAALAAVPATIFSEILQRANFGGDGTVPAGSSHAIGPFGAHDMAGNAFEWTASADRDGRRYAAGGAWDEPSYTFLMPAALDPYDRGSSRGLRLARYDGAVPEVTRQPLTARGRPDFADREPVGDEMFAAFQSFYAYDQRPLDATIHSVDVTSRHYRWERVSYDAAYGGERVLANLLLPKNASPPYQVVVFFPGSEAETLDSSLIFHGLPFYEFILRSGRAVLYPVYKNMFERKIPGWSFSPASRRDVLIQWRKDLGRSIDYIASREDLDSDRIAFYGHSLGAIYGTVLTALEPRLAAALMLGGGVNPGRLPPEADPLNFAPRVRVPTLMLTGRDDFIRPVETHQVPLFNRLGVPDEQKHLARFDGGHTPSDMNAVIRESLAWLDRWMGPVEP